jgi:hypothetical protein
MTMTIEMGPLLMKHPLCIVLGNVEMEVEVEIEEQKEEEELKRDDCAEHLLIQSTKGKLLAIVSLIYFQLADLDQNGIQHKDSVPVPAPRIKSKVIIQKELTKRKPRSRRLKTTT